MKSELEAKVAAAVQQVFGVEVTVELTRPEEQFGDYATNVALQLAAKLQKNPQEVAETLAGHLRESLAEQISEVSIAGPGFINLILTNQALQGAARQEPQKSYEGQEILVEFGDPNPFKEMHLGHLYTAIVGDAIARLFEASGGTVQRLSYHGDVGMHVAKAIWAIRKRLNETANLQIADCFAGDTVVGHYYAEGARAFDEDPAAEEEIRQINASIYARDDEQINAIYDLGRDLSFRNFDQIFEELGVHFQKRYLESESTKAGLQFVQANLGSVFEESEGAVVYRGEKAGLHTRVFINSRGLPTYEAKDLGLSELKNQDYPQANKSVIITAHEQSEYFKVMLAALAEIDPPLAAKTQHLAHGFLSLTTGKMSSRTGQVFAAVNLLDDVRAAATEQFPESEVQQEVYLAAVKYTFLKNRVGGDIIFDVQESVALEGNSGPYLQYAHARARSILRKAERQGALDGAELEPEERTLVRKISEYPEVVDKAVNELMPHHICTYLYELAQTFNRFYEHNRVLGDPREQERLGLVSEYADTLRKGLMLLGIASPEKM
ncbi:MAG TPA: arginine--tRNA ligase [Verrucomicrobiae bacterium]|nr:arginine--tRNA ligase [Verrucomicrobiae bacterium]